MNLIEIGKISSSHGLKGAFKIERYFDNIDIFEMLNEIYVFGYTDPFEIEDVMIKKQSVIIKLKGIDDINTIENLIGCSIYAEKVEIEELDEDKYFHTDLIGLDVICDSNKIGKVKEVINGVNQDVIVVTNGEDECMVPFVKEIVTEISKDTQSITIDAIEGLIPWL